MSVFIIDKPTGMTSFAVVRDMKRLLLRARHAGMPAVPDPRKIGHGGTLDPMASGVLPILVGEATKIAGFLLDADKSYRAEVCFGVETDTLDAEGKVVATHPLADLDETRARGVLAGFVGEIAQVPPMHSALKRAGRRLYEYARAGVEVERPARKVTVFEIAFEQWLPPDRLRFSVRCSKGTYIRSLAADLGRALGTGAHLSALRRTSSGPFRIEDALTPDAARGAIERGVCPRSMSLAQALAPMPMIEVAPNVEAALSAGRKLSWAALGPAAEAVAPAGEAGVVSPDGHLVAVVRRRADPLAGVQGVEILRGFAADQGGAGTTGRGRHGDAADSVEARGEPGQD